MTTPAPEEKQGLAGRIRSERERLGWTQRQLARRVDVHHITVSKWETGVQRPEGEVLDRLAEAFGRPVIWLEHGGEGLAEGISEEIRAAELRGYERAREEIRARLLRALDEAGREERPLSPPIHYGRPPHPNPEHSEGEEGRHRSSRGRRGA